MKGKTAVSILLVVLTVLAVTAIMNPFAVLELKSTDPVGDFTAAVEAGKPVFVMFSSDT